MRVLRPSMSSTDQFLACQWWAFQPVVPEPFSNGVFELDVQRSEDSDATEPARYGSAIHEIIASRILSPPRKLDVAEVAKRFGIPDVPALNTHANEALAKLVSWLRADNPWQVDLLKRAKIRTETAVALDPVKRRVRVIPGPTFDTHEYKAAKPHEFPGTADLVIDEIQTKKDCPDLIVLDHKTGEGWSLPLENGQLLSLALAEKIKTGAKRPAVGIFYSSKTVVSTAFADEVPLELLKKHAEKLKAAWKNIGSGQLRPGAHCASCHAKTICPTQVDALVQVRTKAEMTAERVGEIQMKLSLFRSAAEGLSKEVQAWIRSHGPAVRPDGKLAVIKPVEKENLSMKSIRDAMGVTEGEKMITKLRALGAVKTVSYDEVRAVNDE